MKAELIEVIHTERCGGRGTESDPYRFVQEYWTKGGELLATNDQIDLLAPTNPPEPAVTITRAQFWEAFHHANDHYVGEGLVADMAKRLGLE
jgi:hypothetical protein